MNPHRMAIVLVVLLTATSAAAAVAPADQRVDAVDHRVDRPGHVDATGDRADVTLTVTVTDNFNSGIKDAKVTASWDGGSTSERTKSNGQALIDVPEGATVKLFLNHSSYTINNPVVVEDASTEEVHVEAFRKAEARVTVVSDGTPIEGATVVLTKEDESRAAARGTTNGNGVFSSGTIEKGTYTVDVVKPGFERNRTTVSVKDTTRTQVAIESATASVTFTVTDDHFDDPKAIEGARIEIEGPTSASLTTAGNGQATIGLPVNAKYTVTVTKDGYETFEGTVSLAENSKRVSLNVNREPTLSVEAVNQRVVVGEKVQVTVTDEYGDRVANATVSVDGESVGTTGTDGTLLVPIDAEGEHTITVEKGGTSGSVTVEGVSTGGGDGPGTATDGGDSTGAPIGDISEPTLVMKVGVAAVGVLLAFLVVRRLL